MITEMGWIIIPLSVILVYKLPIKISFLFGYFVSIFTTLSVINISKLDFSFTLPYLWMLLLGIKVICKVITKSYTINIKFNKYLMLFIVIAFISLIYPLLIGDNLKVISPNGIEEKLKFSFQNITQFMYLLYGIYVFILTTLIFNNEKISAKEIDKTITYSCLVIIILCIIQILIPFELYDFFFRNDYNHATHYVNASNTILRASGPFIENSMLALYLTPVLSYIIITFIYNPNVVRGMCIVITTLIGLLSKSSTFILGIGVFIIVFSFICFYMYKSHLDFFEEFFYKLKTVLNKISFKFKNDKKIKVIVIIGLGVLSVTICLFIVMNINLLISKLLGQGESGHLRSDNLRRNIQLFFKYPILGIGFGSTRSGDLLSTWLSQLGIVGIGVFTMFIYSIVSSLKIFSRAFDLGMLLIIMITLSIQFTSVPEPYYLFIWIYFSITYNSKKLVRCVNEI
ncbi:MAG: hypothetical protein E7C49_14245 [Clostridium sp.]|nr:hypothetical protein [Clostridium sp.]